MTDYAGTVFIVYHRADEAAFDFAPATAFD
jgi:hypothetical protein